MNAAIPLIRRHEYSFMARRGKTFRVGYFFFFLSVDLSRYDNIGYVITANKITANLLINRSSKRSVGLVIKSGSNPAVIYYGATGNSWDTEVANFNTLRTGSFKLFKRPFPGFLAILTL